MITSGIHNVSSISKVDISPNPNAEQEGWISLKIETHSKWTDERSKLEITLFCTDLATAVSQLENGIAIAKTGEEATAIG